MQENINLMNQNDGSDKVYNVQLVLDNKTGLYLVNFQNGRRGSTLRPRTKTESAIPYEEAKLVYDRLVKSKLKDGYSLAGGDATSMQNLADKVEINPKALPQLLNEIELDDALRLLEDDDWVLGQKMNGENRPIMNIAGGAQGFNRSAETVPLPLDIAAFFAQDLLNDCTFSAEDVDGRMYVFDIMDIYGQSCRDLPLKQRLVLLEDLLKKALIAVPTINVLMVNHHYDTESKKRAFYQIRDADQEGVVFKKLSSLFVPGRPNSGGDQLKFKFWATATVKVTGARSGKRSVSISVLNDQDNFIGVGNVTVPANKDIPSENEYIEVRYLYYYALGSLFQPTFLRLRTDKNEADKVGQLKLKPYVVLAA